MFCVRCGGRGWCPGGTCWNKLPSGGDSAEDLRCKEGRCGSVVSWDVTGFYGDICNLYLDCVCAVSVCLDVYLFGGWCGIYLWICLACIVWWHGILPAAAERTHLFQCHWSSLRCPQTGGQLVDLRWPDFFYSICDKALLCCFFGEGIALGVRSCFRVSFGIL